MSSQDKTICPHCGQKMAKWEGPAAYSWGSEHLYVCYNDDCQYYVRGWDHTFKTLGIKASYRHRFDPNTGQVGPFPVNSPEAGKSCIVAE